MERDRGREREREREGERERKKEREREREREKATPQHHTSRRFLLCSGPRFFERHRRHFCMDKWRDIGKM